MGSKIDSNSHLTSKTLNSGSGALRGSAVLLTLNSFVDFLSEQNINDLATRLTEKEIGDEELRLTLKLVSFPSLDGILSRIYHQLG